MTENLCYSANNAICNTTFNATQQTIEDLQNYLNDYFDLKKASYNKNNT
jgi:1,4-dihydroxy-2-naphthoate octaprenyltransferase